MHHAESSLGSERIPIPDRVLKPYEVKEVAGGFVACLPVYGTRNVADKDSVIAYGERIFDTKEEAYIAVRSAKESLGIADKLN